MTTTLPHALPPEAAAPAPSTAVDPTARQRWRRERLIAAALLVVLAGSLAVVLAGSGAKHGQLDPRSYDKSGTHAVAALLRERGVRVDTSTDPVLAQAQARKGDTLVVVLPERLTDDELGVITSSPADLVIVGAGGLELGALGLGVEPAGVGDDSLRLPECALPAATVAGSVVLGGEGYRPQTGSAEGCYPLGDGSGLLVLNRDGRQVTLLADGTLLQNDHLAKDGDAALALGVLGRNPHVVWLVPLAIAPQHPIGPRRSVTDLLPPRLKWAVLQLAIAVVAVALWRGRRFGRLVPERLPVVVRQSETVLGRARLYRRSRSSGRAAEALREGARDRLSRRLGFGPGQHRSALVESVAARTGRSAADVDALLYGAAPPSSAVPYGAAPLHRARPTDDHALVVLAHDLATLEQEVLRP